MTRFALTLVLACAANSLCGEVAGAARPPRTFSVSAGGDGDFTTVSAAAAAAGPGDVVLVEPGVYREEVRVAAGGRPGAPVVFRSRVRGAAVLKGSEVWTNGWRPLAGSEGCLEGDIDVAKFAGRKNPYLTTISIGPSDKSRAARPVAEERGAATFAPRTLGQIFVDGAPYSEVVSLDSLRRSAGTWMVSYDGRRIWIHPAEKDADLGRALVEWSVRDRVFHAMRRGLEHVVFDGFTVEHGANQGPFPQVGLVDARSGRNWVVQNCVVRHAKTVGIAIGGETWDAKSLADVPEEDRRVMTADGNVVRNCEVSDCGLCGVAGWHPGRSSVCNNVLERNNCGGYGWPEKYWGEDAAVKMHIFKGVIAGNVIRGNDAHGIWLDTGFAGARVTGNLVIGNKESGIMLESAVGPALVDNNIVGQTRPGNRGFNAGDGIYSHNGSRVTVAHNLVFGCAGAGVRFRTLWGKYQDGRAYETSENRFVGNVFCQNAGGDVVVACTNETSHGGVSDYNVFYGNEHLSKAAPLYPFRFANYNIGPRSWADGSWTGLHARVSAVAGEGAMSYQAWRAMANPATLREWRSLQGMDLNSWAGAARTFEFSAAEMSLAWAWAPQACAIEVPAVDGIDRDYFGNPYPKPGAAAFPGPFQDASLVSTNVVSLSVAPWLRASGPVRGKSAAFDAAGGIAAAKKVLRHDLWHGYKRTVFDFEGHEAWVVEPKCEPAAGRPWTWTMQWADAFVDRTGVLDLLAKGWHHVTIGTFRHRMDEEGLRVSRAFQKFLVEELGFAEKANLVGMSWGGFFSTRYAAAFPECVGKIYLDAPLLNFSGFAAAGAASTPTESASKIGPWAAMPPADGDWSADPRLPVNMADSLAKAGIPILLLYGGQDATVPPAKNCELFAERFQAAGGKIEIKKRNLFGHHPHGEDPDKTSGIVSFFEGTASYGGVRRQ